MSEDAANLKRYQSWMQAVITHPAGIGAGIASPDARHSFDLAFEALEKVIAPSRVLTGAERLAIYSRAYYARLLECFRAEFPCLLYALGDDLFTHFVTEYLRYDPPRSYTLHQLAANFPAFLAKTRPDAEAPPEERESWPDFIIDLASLERAFIETYDGPGAEGQPLVKALTISNLALEGFAQMRLVAIPGLKLLAFRYPVRAYFAAVREKQEADLPAPSNTFLAIMRKNYVVRFLDLSAAQYELLRGLIANLSVEQAVIEAAKKSGEKRESLTLKVRDWLCHWAKAGFFHRYEKTA
jgi:hypothetical protein